MYIYYGQHEGPAIAVGSQAETICRTRVRYLANLSCRTIVRVEEYVNLL